MTLESGIKQCEGDYANIKGGTLRPTGPVVADPAAQVNRLGSELASLVGELGRQIDEHNAVGAGVNQGWDLSAVVVEVYSSIVACAREAMTANVPPEWQPVYLALLQCARQPLRQLRAFSANASQGLIVDLNVQLDPIAVQSLERALNAVTGH